MFVSRAHVQRPAVGAVRSVRCLVIEPQSGRRGKAAGRRQRSANHRAQQKRPTNCLTQRSASILGLSGSMQAHHCILCVETLTLLELAHKNTVGDRPRRMAQQSNQAEEST